MTETPLEQLERTVGHPGRLYEQLIERIQSNGMRQFGSVQDEWLGLMWCLDRYRVEGVAPRGMGNQRLSSGRRLAAIYRMKGNWFALMIAALLQNRTDQEIAAKSRVQGFSQPHQVDVAWPPRLLDPLVCIETKVTGAPRYGDTPSRSAMGDFSNRRKEVKFAATDLKLYRRQDETSIEHWGVWRESAPPKTYFLWAARLRTGARPDDLAVLAREARALVDTYLDGAGLVAWRERPDGAGYEYVPLPTAERVTSLDDVLYRVATEIHRLAPRGSEPPRPRLPRRRAVATEALLPDTSDDGLD